MISDHKLNKTKWDFLRYDLDYKKEVDYFREVPSHYTNNYYYTGLLIDENSSPKINDLINNICKKLLLPRNCVDLFVHASSEIQASCLNISSKKCVIKISSSLINLLNEAELSFVIGHELGHFIFEHGSDANNEYSLEFFQKLRSQEISVDRIGLISCGKLDHAMSAIVKTVSGLNENFLNFNIGHFINQIHHTASLSQNENITLDTHPPFILRSRALLLFASSGVLNANLEDIGDTELKKINQGIKKEFDRFVDLPLNNKINKILNECAIWEAARIILKDEKFDKEEQEKFKNRFDKDVLQKLINFINSFSKNDVINQIEKKIEENKDNLKSFVPNQFQKKYTEMENGIRVLFEK